MCLRSDLFNQTVESAVVVEKISGPHPQRRRSDGPGVQLCGRSVIAPQGF